MLLSQGAVRSAVALDGLPSDLRDTLRDELGVTADDDPVVTFLGASNVLLAGPAEAAGASRGGPPLAPTAVMARPGPARAAPPAEGGADEASDLGARRTARPRSPGSGTSRSSRRGRPWS